MNELSQQALALCTDQLKFVKGFMKSNRPRLSIKQWIAIRYYLKNIKKEIKYLDKIYVYKDTEEYNKLVERLMLIKQASLQILDIIEGVEKHESTS